MYRKTFSRLWNTLIFFKILALSVGAGTGK
jgi:hypothetical protein